MVGHDIARFFRRINNTLAVALLKSVRREAALDQDRVVIRSASVGSQNSPRQFSALGSVAVIPKMVRATQNTQGALVAESAFFTSNTTRNGCRTSGFRATLGALLATMFVSTVFAQTSTREFDAANGGVGSGGTGPSTANQVVTFRNNQNNPADNVFNTTLNAVTATFALTNPATPTIPNLAFGRNFSATSTTFLSLPNYTTINAIGVPSNGNFSSLAAGTGIDVAVNGAVQVSARVNGLATATNTRNLMGQLTVTFSPAVTNPVLHFGGLGGSYASGTTLGFTSEFDLLTVGAPMTRLSGTTNFVINNTVAGAVQGQINNNAANPNSSCATGTQAACGSVRFTGTFSTLSFNVYVRGDGGNAAWGPGATGEDGDVFTMSASLDSLPNLIVNKTASVANVAQNGTFSYTLSAQNTGTASSAANTTITDVIPTGITVNTITGVPAGWVCTPSSAVPLVGNGTTSTVTCVAAAGLAPAAAAVSIATLNVTKSNSAAVSNTATVTSGDPACVAPLPLRCTSTVTVNDVTPRLTVTKSSAPGAFVVGAAGQSYTITIAVANGPTTAAISVADTLQIGRASCRERVWR